MYHLLWIFFIYAFLGWCTEVSYAALKTGRFVNRGFLNGPVCPVYGFGVVIVLWVLEPLRGNLLLLFLGSVALTSLLEWLTGFVLERLFHQRWWDYSQEPFNLGGYICLRFSIAWGLACLFVVKLLHPSVLWCIRTVPYPMGVGLLALFSAVMAVDLAATVRTIARMNRQLSQLDELAAGIKEMSNELGANLPTGCWTPRRSETACGRTSRRSWMTCGRFWLPADRSFRMVWKGCGTPWTRPRTPWPSTDSSFRWTRRSGWRSGKRTCGSCGHGWMRPDRAASSGSGVC